MRFVLKVNIPVESGNAAAKAGKLGATIQSILADLKPEAVYFTNSSCLRVIYVPEPEPESVFVITAYELRGKPLFAYRRRLRKKGRR